ncbi:MAG: hypothetical protein ACJA09_002677 [Alcanivorax sp.]|jgi:hypothetical protein
MKIRSNERRFTALLMVGLLTLPQVLCAQEAVDESPNEFAMVGDLLVARPIGLVMTAGGAAVWLVSLPFTLLAGHAGEAAETLILGPGAATFVRCLGCRDTGYTNKDVKRYRESQGESGDDS